MGGNQVSSRRALLKGACLVAGAFGGQLAGLFPDAALADGKHVPALRGRELSGRAADATHGISEHHRDGAGVRSFLAQHRFAMTGRGAAVAIDDESSKELGRTTLSDWSDGQETARLIQHQKDGRLRSSLGVWSDDAPGRVSVYGDRGGRTTLVGTIEQRGTAIVIVDEYRKEQVITLPQHRAAKLKAGALATLMSDPRGYVQDIPGCVSVCSTVTFVVCGLSCELSFFVVCTVLLELGGLPGLACFLVSFGVCFVTCSVAQDVLCSTLCP